MPPEDSWDAVQAAAERHQLQPALWPAVRRLGAVDAVPAGARRDLEEHLRRNQVRNLLLRRQLVEAAGALNLAGIEPMALKGALALARPVFPDPGARYMDDLDLLIRADDLPRATEVLTSLGYEARPWRFNDFSGPAHDLPFFGLGRPGPVELHVELGRTTVAGVLPSAALWQRTEPLELDGCRLWAPWPAHQVLHNVLHAQVHDRAHAVGALPLRDLYSLAWTLHRFGDHLDWDEVVGRMGAGDLAPVLRDHMHMARRLLSVPVPRIVTPGTRSRLHLLRVGAYTALGFPEDVERRLRFTFAADHMGHLYGPFDGSMALSAARGRHAGRLALGLLGRARHRSVRGRGRR